MSGRAQRDAAMIAAAIALLLCGAAPRRGLAADDPVAAGFAALERDRPREALAHFIAASRANPASARNLCYVGLGYFKAGDFENALEYFERSLQQDPSLVDSAFLFYRANCYRALGLRSMERTAWKALIDWDPRSRFADAGREAAASGRRERAPQSRALLERGLDVWHKLPHAAAAYFREAASQQESQWRTEARVFLACALNTIERHEEVLQLEPAPESDAALAGLMELQRAAALAGLERWDEAMAALQKRSFESVVRGQAEYLKSLCLIQLGRQEEATDALAALKRVFSTEAVAHLVTLAEVHMQHRALK